MIVRPGIPDELRWFADARFGMFVHYGLYALLERGEWVMYEENIPRDEYEKLAERFDPHLFDAEQWVGVALSAGARYITVTAKHHDGFCLFESELTDYHIGNTPFGRDLIGELVEACHLAEMRIIFYYSQPDWHHPNYVHNPGAFKDLDNPPESNEPDWGRYVEYYMGQVRELCTNYGHIDGIWFDGSHKTVEEWHGREVYDMIKELQPGAVVNDRARWGDFFTPERSLPEDLTEYMFEACESVSPTNWGYQGDTALHSGPHLIRSLVKMAGAGGNSLLNVGPAPDGTIPVDQAARMRDIGRWLESYGESVYGTQAGPALPDENLRATRKGNSIYVHLFEWPETNRMFLPGFGRADVEFAMLLPYNAPLKVEEAEGGIELHWLPSLPFDASANVIRIDLRAVPETFERRPPVPDAPQTTAIPPGGAVFGADDATLEGRGVKGAQLRVLTDEPTGRRYIDHWMVPDHLAHWDLDLASGGRYSVTVSLRASEAQAGAVVAVRFGEQEVAAEAPATGDPPGFVDVHAGVLDLPAGNVRLTVGPHTLKWGYLLCGVEKVALEPA